MPSPQNKTVPASSAEDDHQSDGKAKGQSFWNRSSSQEHQQPQSPYIVVNSPATIRYSPYLRTLLQDNKQAVVIHPITRESHSSSLHMTSSSSSSSSSLPSSSILNLQPTRLFPVMGKQKPCNPGFSQANLSWAQHGSRFVKTEEEAVSKKNTVPTYVSEKSPNTERVQKKSSEGSDSTAPGYPVHYATTCRFPSCEKTFADHQHFLRHLYNNHHLDEKTTVQCIIQAELVHTLEEQLAVQKNKLHEMQTLMNGKLDTVHNPTQRERSLILQQSHHAGVSVLPGLNLSVPMQNDFSDTVLALRRHLWEDTSIDIFDSRTNCIEFYKTNNVRPPLTYASLIRWAILQSPQKQLALNEIYQWFTKMFAFFRLNKVTWKNAVRHNLSLHKCFVRVENMKGAVWMVDELEFQRKRGVRGSH